MRQSRIAAVGSGSRPEAGSKLDRARDLGVEIIDEGGFEELVS